MRVSKIEWFMFQKKQKANMEGQSASWIILLSSTQYIITIRTSHSQMFFEIGVPKVCNIHKKKPVLLESLFSKVGSLGAYKFIRKRHQCKCFSVNIANFLRKFYLKNITASCFCCTWNSPGIWLYKSGNLWHIFSILSKYSMSFYLISEIIHPRQLTFNDAKRSWILY